jgi:hypothetical protein
VLRPHEFFDKLAKGGRYSYAQFEENLRAAKKEKKKLLDGADLVHILFFPL